MLYIDDIAIMGEDHAHHLEVVLDQFQKVRV